MNKRFRSGWLSFVTLVALVASSAYMTNAHADGSTPDAPASSPHAADTSAPAASVAPADTSAPASTSVPPASVAPANTSAPADTSTSSTSASPASTPVASPITTTSADTTVPSADTSAAATPVASTDTTDAPATTAAPATASAWSQIPSGTPVVAVDGTGTPQPLATQAAANIINSNDPIWCPVILGVQTLPGDSNCTPGESSVTDLLNDLSSKSGAGTVYFESSYSNNDATFDHTNPNLTNLTDLTIQGGWNGSLVSPSIDTTGGTTFSVPLSVTNWNSNVTINDILVSGATGDGVTVTMAPASTGDISLHHVKSDGNTGRGAYLDNCALSGTCQAAGNITVDSHSEFNNNQSQGLFALSAGDINIDNVIADNNSSSGAVLQNFLPPSSGVINISNSTFNSNSNTTSSTGLLVHSNGNITLNSVIADNNGIVGDSHLSVNLLTNLNVLIDNSEFNNNLHDGADMTGASIMVQNSHFNGNTNNGANLNGTSITVQNSQSNGNTGNGLVTNGDATITCSSASNNTAGYGVDSTAGSLTLDGVTLNGNSSGATNASSPTITDTCHPASGGNNGGSNNQSGSGSGGSNGLPYTTVNVMNGAGNTLDCRNYKGASFVLPDGDLVMIPCTAGGGQITLSDQPSTSLPGALSGQTTYISAFSVTTTTPLTGSMTVAFLIPAGKEGSNFAILHWNDSTWQNLGGTRGLPKAGYFGVQTTLTGTFVLVAQ